MVCKFEYNGKTYSQDELAKELEKMPPSEAHKYIYGVQNVPNMPFKKNWDELALKKIIRHAAENGYDAISWTPGEAQAARYDLSKQISEVHYNQTKEILTAYDHNGKAVISEKSTPEKLSDYIGKEAAQKLFNEGKEKPFEKVTKLPEGYELIKDGKEWGIIPPGQGHARPLDGLHPNKETAINSALNYINRKYSATPDETYRLKGQDLKIGGEGMKGFYDKILVDRANNLAKKFGSKVEGKSIMKDHYAVPGRNGKWDVIFDKGGTGKVEKTFASQAEAENYVNERSQPIHYLPLTPALKDVALKKGFPLFSAGISLTPIEHDPYKTTPVDTDPFK